MKISVFSYLFPPDKEVGGRRWGIFAKELAALGHQVVVTTCNTSPDKRAILQQEQKENLQFRFFEPSKFAKTRPNGLKNKLVWHLIKHIRLINSEGWIYDPSLGIQSQIEAHVNSDIASGTDIIVVSCAPFRWSYIIGQTLKNAHQGPKLVLDLRDPWTRNKLAYFHALSPVRLRQEKRIEQIAIDSAHGITVAHEKMLSDYMHPNQIFLPNNVRIPTGQWLKKPINQELHFVFPGTLYRAGLDELVDFLERCSNDLPEHDIVLHVLGSWSPEVLQTIQQRCRIQNHGYVAREKVPTILSKAHFVLTYVSPLLPYAINTKIIEAIENRLPTIILGSPCFQDFVNENKIGWIYDRNWSQAVLRGHLLSDSCFGPFADRRFDISNAVETLASFLLSTAEYHDQ